MSRLFVAIWPTEEVMRHVGSLPRDGWQDVRWIPEANWHITLRFLGEDLTERVADALSAVDLPAVTAEVSSRIVRLGSRSLIVPIAGVDALAKVVTEATEGLGNDPLGGRFRGHITVGRSLGQKPIKGEPDATDPVDPVRFEVGEIAVVASTLTNQGAVYETTATFRTAVTRPDDGDGR